MLSKKIISGIQQVGIGNPNTPEAWKWYRKHFGMDIPVFDEAAVAELMLPYTGNKPQKRHAVLAINSQGGGGFEIWQYTERKTVFPDFTIQAGDTGIFAAKIKARDVSAAYNFLSKSDAKIIGNIKPDPLGKSHFFLQDLYGNLFEVCEGLDWFTHGKHATGGPQGVIIGVSDMEKALDFYKKILEYDTVIFDKTGGFEDLCDLPGGKNNFRRVLLTHSQPRKGAFSQMLGKSCIELWQCLDRAPEKIFKNRFWGDAGFIHLCFDIQGMDLLREECKQFGCPFTVDTGNSFDMGEAAGAFAYIEDPDGTLIEFVETHKIPVLKKLGLYLNLKKRNPEKALPKFMLKMLALNRVKD